MLPLQAVRIKEEIPDPNPSEMPRIPASNSMVQIPEIKTEFVAVKQEIMEEYEELASPPEKPTVNVKGEPRECIDIVIKLEPLEKGVEKPPSNDGAETEKETSTEQPCPTISIVDQRYLFQSPPKPEVIEKGKCQVCKKTFKSEKLLKSHMRTHSNDDDTIYKCNKCNRTLKSKQTLKAHEARGGCKPRPDLICQDCGQVFNRMLLYRSHVKIHSEIRPYHCDYCPMAFRHSSTLMNHVQLHTNDQPYQCPVCKEFFNGRGLIKAHVSIHVGDKPHPCPICQKTFTLKHNTVKHVLIHCREKVLTCSICQKTFPRESRLRYHMNSHTKAKPFCCDLCGRFFSHKANVIRHLIRRHPGLVKEGLYRPTK